MNLVKRLQDLLLRTLTGMVDDPAPYASMVKPAGDSRHGDYQVNAAMSLAKVLKRKPQDVAAEIVTRLDLGDWLQPPQVAGPGFINLSLRADWMAKQIQALASDTRLGVAPENPARTYVVDFSSPNVAKPMHVGHLRSTIIGDSLVRLLRFLGHTVVTDNHLGDWGTQFGILLYGYKNHLDKDAYQLDPVKELARLYILIRKMMKGDEDEEGGTDPIAEACRQETAKLHAGDAENLQLWQEFMPHCLEELAPIYRRLDVHFDHTLGESYYNPMLEAVVTDLLARRIAEESQGAIAVFFGEEKAPALIRKRDGAYTYTTTDLATVKYRIDHWAPDAILYVVDFRQTQHFQNIFEIIRRWRAEKLELAHISFGSVLDKETRKPISTRKGDGTELSNLLDEAVRRAAKVYEANLEERLSRGEEVEPLEGAERQAALEAVGLGAVKYADLCQNRTSDYVFDWEKMLAMEGNTGTYMQYAYARVQGIFRKAGVVPTTLRASPPEVLLTTPHERALALQLLRLNDALQIAGSEYLPNIITSYLWDLAKTYSGFFQNCHVLRAESPELRASRLLLCDLTGRTLRLCLDLLGIRTPERI